MIYLKLKNVMISTVFCIKSVITKRANLQARRFFLYMESYEWRNRIHEKYVFSYR